MAVAGKPYLPPKTLLIHPSPLTTNSIYGPKSADARPIATWIDRERSAWKCDFDPIYGYESCGTTFSWGSSGRVCAQGATSPPCADLNSDPDGDGWGWENDRACLMVAADSAAVTAETASAQPPPQNTGRGPADIFAPSAKREMLGCENFTRTAMEGAPTARRSLDLTAYDSVKVKLHYEGRAKFIRLYLRDFNPANTGYENFSAGKFMSAYLRTDDLKAGAAYVDLNEFTVEEWWIMLHNPPRNLAAPEFAHVVTVGIDHIEHGTHQLRVEEVELVGERISMETVLMALAIFWSGFLLLEAAVRYVLLIRSNRKRQHQLDQLAGRAEQLESEKDALTTRATTDSLTGALNRGGFAQKLNLLSAEGAVPSGYGLIIIDIDHFKRMNDRHGHDVGDRVLCALVQTINAHIREEDVLARWGGEEFILLTPQKNQQSLLNTAEKLRACVAATGFGSMPRISVTISLGAAFTASQEAFDTLFKRADVALYRAKLSRNAVASEP